jgi:hypothetical protein
MLKAIVKLYLITVNQYQRKTIGVCKVATPFSFASVASNHQKAIKLIAKGPTAQLFPTVNNITK